MLKKCFLNLIAYFFPLLQDKGFQNIQKLLKKVVDKAKKMYC